jgi:hypothetical protein
MVDLSSKNANAHSERGNILEKAQCKKKLNPVLAPIQRKGCIGRTVVISGAAASEEVCIQQEIPPIDSTRAVQKADTSASAQDSSVVKPNLPQKMKVKMDDGGKAAVAEKAIVTQENRFRSRIHKFCTRTWMVVDGVSAFYWRWCLLVLVCVMFSSVVFPVLLGFGYETTGAGTFVVEFVFMVDLLISFHASYFDPKKCEQETDLVRIRHHYLHGWFAYDLLGSFPVQFVASAATSSGGSCCSEHTLSTLKMLHLLKVFRLMHAKDLQLRGNLTPSMVRLFKLLCSFFFILHWVACAYWAIVMTEGSVRLTDTIPTFGSR